MQFWHQINMFPFILHTQTLIKDIIFFYQAIKAFLWRFCHLQLPIALLPVSLEGYIASLLNHKLLSAVQCQTQILLASILL